MKKIISTGALAITMLLTCAAGADAGLVTLLVDFQRPDASASSSASDFAANDAAIDLSAPVNVVNGGESTAISGVNIVAEVSRSAGGTFSTGAGNTLGIPIYNSYVTNRGAIPITVTSLEEFATGTDVNLVFYAVGDATNQDGRTTITYNGVASDVIETDNAVDGDDNFVDDNAFASFVFTKVEGVDEILISSDGTNRNRGFNGFSFTGTDGLSSVPEPTSLALVGIPVVGMLFRRKRS